jgi:hypothetical protein
MPAWLHSNSEEVSNLSTVENTPQEHRAHLTHEVLAGAAAAYAAKKWEDHEEKKTGEKPKHEGLKEFAAGAAASFLTHIVETKGRDAIDEHKRKKLQEDATKKIHETITVSEKDEWKNVSVSS